MSNYNNSFDAWIEAFTILKKYDKDIEMYAENNYVWIGPSGVGMNDISLDDQLRIQELGWLIEDNSFIKLV